MNIDAKLVKTLRDKTGAGMMDCKKALTETAGDIQSAVDWLRTKGLATAAKKAGRVASEGLVVVVSLLVDLSSSPVQIELMFALIWEGSTESRSNRSAKFSAGFSRKKRDQTEILFPALSLIE